MADERLLNLYLPAQWRLDHKAGKVNIITRLTEALTPSGWQIIDRPQDEGARQPAQRGYGLTYMQEPRGPRTVCLRRAYFYPFWRIEATNARWNYPVARMQPALAEVPSGPAQNLHRRLREKCFGKTDPASSREGFVFMPLQGRLLDHRSFQSMSPVAMIEATLRAEPSLEIRATLHPGESYSAAERAALDRLETAHSRFRLVQAPAADLIARCDYVVCQNSSVALAALIAGKGAVLFAGIDFHHPAGSVPRDGLERAFEKGREPPARLAKYLYWFFRLQAIDMQAAEAADDVRQTLGRLGLPVE